MTLRFPYIPNKVLFRSRDEEENHSWSQKEMPTEKGQAKGSR